MENNYVRNLNQVAFFNYKECKRVIEISGIKMLVNDREIKKGHTRNTLKKEVVGSLVNMKWS